MTTDQWFEMLIFLGTYLAGLLLLDAAHKAHIAELKRAHREEAAALRGYIRTLHRERKWFEAELTRQKEKVKQAKREQTAFDPFAEIANSSDPTHIQWLPPSEEYNEED